MNIENSKAEFPSKSKTVIFDTPGDADVLRIDAIEIQSPGPGDILVHVAAAGINRPDILQRAGSYPPPPGATKVLGLEVAGTVAAVGENVNSWSVGQPVCALTNGGGYSEYCVVPASQCLPIPSTLDFIQAAALPEAAFTVWGNVFAPERGNLAPGETFLVHGGSSGIGTLAIQMAAAMGATVYATAGSEEKCAACLELGASEAINYRKAEFADEIKRLTDGKGVDVILDMVGGASVSKNIRSLKRDGRLVFIAFIEGSKTDLDLMPVMLKRLRITGSTLRAQSAEQKARIADALRETIWPLIEAKLIAPVIFKTLPLEKVAEAHKLMESNKHIGKIVLDVATG